MRGIGLEAPTGRESHVERAAEARRHPRLGPARRRLPNRARAATSRARTRGSRGARADRLGPGARASRARRTGGSRRPAQRVGAGTHAGARRPGGSCPDRLGTAARGGSPARDAAGPGATRCTAPAGSGPSSRRRLGCRTRGGATGPGAGGGATPPWNPAPAKSSGNGCLKACLIVGAILVVLFFIAVAGIVFLGNQIIKSVPIDEQGNLQACPFVSNDQLSGVLGSGTEAVPLTGFFDATIGIILDKRVMPDDEDCWITADGSTGTGRIARYQGSDAGAKFLAEKQAAQPTSQDQGNGVTLENPGYFAGDVSGVGDEAFCTDFSSALMEGVLVRQGDTLVYVSLQGGTDSAESTCQQAQRVAQAILR